MRGRGSDWYGGTRGSSCGWQQKGTADDTLVSKVTRQKYFFGPDDAKSGSSPQGTIIQNSALTASAGAFHLVATLITLSWCEQFLKKLRVWYVRDSRGSLLLLVGRK